MRSGGRRPPRSSRRVGANVGDDDDDDDDHEPFLPMSHVVHDQQHRPRQSHHRPQRRRGGRRFRRGRKNDPHRDEEKSARDDDNDDNDNDAEDGTDEEDDENTTTKKIPTFGSNNNVEIESIVRQRMRLHASSLREMDEIESKAFTDRHRYHREQKVHEKEEEEEVVSKSTSNATNINNNEAFLVARRRGSSEGALKELEHIERRLVEAKKMKDREQGRRTQFTAVAEKKHALTMGIEEKKGEEEEGIFFVGSPAASGASPKSPRLPFKFGRTEEGVMVSPPLPPTPPNASTAMVATMRKRKDNNKIYDSEDLKRLVSLLYFARLFDVKDAASAEIEHARVIQRDACIAKHESYTGIRLKPLTGEDLDAVVIAGRSVVCQRRDVTHHGACIAVNTKAAKMFLRAKDGKVLSNTDVALVKQQVRPVERMNSSSRDESGFFERMLNMGSSSGAMASNNAVAGGEHYQQHQQQSAKLTREEVDAIKRARDVMNIIMAMAPAELSESSDMEKEEEDAGLKLGVSSRDRLREAQQLLSKVSIKPNNNRNRRREDIIGDGRNNKKRNAARNASRKVSKHESENAATHTIFEEGGASEDRSTSSHPQSPSTPLRQTDDTETFSPKQMKTKRMKRGGRRRTEPKREGQARLREREEARAEAVLD